MVSIIVPVYNASEFITKCIESVINQAYKDFELIIINDGSTDNSLEICQSFAIQDKRIKIVNKENSGVSTSRNIGIKESSGEWIMFLDADDWLENNCLSICVQKINETEAELLCFNHYTNTELSEWKMIPITDGLITNKNNGLKSLSLSMMYPHFYFIKNNIQVGSIRAVWGKFFKSDIIKQNNILFDQNIKIAEDAIFCLDYISQINKAVLINNYLLHYRVHNASIMNRYQKDIVAINEEILKAFYVRFKSQIIIDNDVLKSYCGNAIECLFRALKLNILHKENKSSLKTKLKEISILLQNKHLQTAFSCDNYKYFPLGKRELLYFSRKKSSLGIYLVGQISTLALFLQSAKNNLLNHLKSTPYPCQKRNL